MAEQDTKKGFFQKLKRHYRLVFYNDSNFEEMFNVRITLLNVLSIMGTICLVLIGGTIILVMFTPLRELVPGYPSQTMRNQLVANVMRMDSLQYELQVRDKYFNAINAFIAGREPEMAEPSSDTTAAKYADLQFPISKEDSLLRKQVEEEEQFNLQPTPAESTAKLHFFKPIAGVVTNKFDLKSGHYGCDIVATPNGVVKAALDGTVILATWTVETGYVLQIQHDNNFITVYKHNASLLKKQGDHVKAGDAIAIIGNTGTLTTGPHLHFEIWQAGKPVNPEDYIVF